MFQRAKDLMAVAVAEATAAAMAAAMEEVRVVEPPVACMTNSRSAWTAAER